MKPLRYVARALGVLLMGLGGAALVFWLFARKNIAELADPELGGMALSSSGPGQQSFPVAAPMVCTAAQTMDAPRYKARQDQRAAQLIKASTRVQADTDGQELWDTPHGRFWVLAGELSCLTEVLAEQAFHIYEEHGEGVRDGDVVLDGGAHYGAYVRHALQLGAKLVVAIEIAPGNISCLRKTFADEIRAGRVIVYPKGIWDKDDELVLQLDRLSTGNSVVRQRERQGPKVPLTSIDKLVAELRLPKVDFIKLDIEGAETRAIKGAAETLRKFRPRLALSAYHRRTDLIDLVVGVRDVVPTYWVSFGPCRPFGERLAPIVLFFH
jgi:FkbM family methyltransferase